MKFFTGYSSAALFVADADMAAQDRFAGSGAPVAPHGSGFPASTVDGFVVGQRCGTGWNRRIISVVRSIARWI
jgi:hypothetical protein